jgi:hypothetical protein
MPKLLRIRDLTETERAEEWRLAHSRMAAGVYRAGRKR